MRRSTPLHRACAATAISRAGCGPCLVARGSGLGPGQDRARAPGRREPRHQRLPLTSGGNKTIATPLFSHAKRTRSLNFSATFTNTGDPSDTVQASGHYRATWAVAKKGADLHKVSLSGSGTVSLDVAKGAGTGCGDSSAVAEGGGILQFTEHHDGWFYVAHHAGDPGRRRHRGPELRDRRPGPARPLPGGRVPRRLARLLEGRAVQRRDLRRRDHRQHRVGQEGTAQLDLDGLLPHGLGAHRHQGRRQVGTSRSRVGQLWRPRATLRWKSGAGRVAAGSFLVNGKKKELGRHPERRREDRAQAPEERRPTSRSPRSCG